MISTLNFWACHEWVKEFSIANYLICFTLLHIKNKCSLAISNCAYAFWNEKYNGNLPAEIDQIQRQQTLMDANECTQI